MLMYIVIIVSCNSRMTNCTLQNRDVFQILGTDAGNPCVLEGFGFVTSPAVLRNSSCAAHQCRQWGTLPSLSGQSIPGKQWGGASRVADSLCCLLSCVWAAPSRAWSILSHTRTNHGRIRSSPALGGLTAFPSLSHLLLAQLDQRHAGLRSSLLAPHSWRDARTPARPRPAPRPLTAWSAQLAPLHPCCPGPAHRSASRWIPSFSPCFQGRRAPAAHWLLRSNRSGPPPPARVDDVTAAPEPPRHGGREGEAGGARSHGHREQVLRAPAGRRGGCRPGEGCVEATEDVFWGGGQQAWRGLVGQGLRGVVRRLSVNQKIGAGEEGCWGHWEVRAGRC